MENSFKKIELGCGKTKSQGYIGIDRFQLPGVDIVADLNRGIPLDDDSVDVILAGHSLEHFDDIFFTMQEIYRVLKDKGILMVIAPYYMQTLNMVNFFHKTAFTEELFRFLSPFDTVRFTPEECECPHAGNYPLSQSDNSDNNIAFEPLYKEMFYYEAYRDLSEEAKLHVRKSLFNVCDQFYIALAVNKTGSPFSSDLLNELETSARKLEPEYVEVLRNRDKQIDKSKKSLITDLDNLIISLAVPRYEYEVLNDSLDILKVQQKEFAADSKQISERLNYLESLLLNLIEIQSNIESEFSALNTRNENQLIEIQSKQASYAALTFDLIRFQEQRTKIFGKKLYRKSHDLLPSLMTNHMPFIEGVTLRCKYFSAGKILTFSDAVPFDRNMQYEITGNGNKMNLFLIATPNAKLQIEIVNSVNKTKQEIMNLEGDGHITVNTEEMRAIALIRFRILDNYSIVRILQVTSRNIFFAKNKIAAFLE